MLGLKKKKGKGGGEWYYSLVTPPCTLNKWPNPMNYTSCIAPEPSHFTPLLLPQSLYKLSSYLRSIIATISRTDFLAHSLVSFSLLSTLHPD